jgi:hypothetical protein
MNGIRHSIQRRNRVRVKADAAVLLDRIASMYGADMTDRMRTEIAEMRLRLDPAPGVKAPIIHTGYTKG